MRFKSVFHNLYFAQFSQFFKVFIPNILKLFYNFNLEKQVKTYAKDNNACSRATDVQTCLLCPQGHERPDPSHAYVTEDFLMSSTDSISSSFQASDDLTERIYLAGQAGDEATIATVALSDSAISQPYLTSCV